MQIQHVALVFGRRRRARVLLAVLGISLLLSTLALALVAQGYTISWWTVDGGGDASSGDGYTLSGAVGQADAGPVLSHGSYTLTGGFWGGAMPSYRLYLSLVLRQH